MKRCICKISHLLIVLLFTGGAVAETTPIKLSLTPGYTTLLDSRPSTIPIKVSLEGANLPTKSETRANANVAIVIDRSSSMAGDKITQAKEAAILAVSMLSNDDIVSVITYDNSAQVVVPATKLTSKHWVIEQIRGINLGGYTALFAGVSLGAAEIAKFRDPSLVNRIVLLSDGMANVGPSNPAQLGELGASLGKDGIAVSTIGLGLGYNEDLMTQLALKSDGNHVFAEKASDLAHVFEREFKDILSVVAQNVSITITCRPGVRPTRVLGRDASIYGNRVVSRLNQVYGGQEKYLLFEVEVDPSSLIADQEIAAVEIQYFDPIQKRDRRLDDRRRVTLSSVQADIDTSIDRPTFAAYYTQLSTIASEEAIKLADSGKKHDAVALLEGAAATSRQAASELNIPALEEDSRRRSTQGAVLSRQPYDKARKQLKFENYSIQNNQAVQ